MSLVYLVAAEKQQDDFDYEDEHVELESDRDEYNGENDTEEDDEVEDEIAILKARPRAPSGARHQEAETEEAADAIPSESSLPAKSLMHAKPEISVEIDDSELGDEAGEDKHVEEEHRPALGRKRIEGSSAVAKRTRSGRSSGASAPAKKAVKNGAKKGLSTPGKRSSGSPVKKKATASSAIAKKSSGKKIVGKKAPAKKAPAKKAAVKKNAPKKAPVKKAFAKGTTKRRR